MNQPTSVTPRFLFFLLYGVVEVKSSMKEKICGIYCIENLVNGKKYIGKSIDIKKRIAEHITKLTKNKHGNIYLQNAFNKYEMCNFSFYIVEECEEIIINEKEIYYISLYNANNDKYGYNLTEGGEGSRGYKHSPEELIKMSISLKGKNTGKRNGNWGKSGPFKGENKKPLSKETKEKMSAVRKGVPKSEKWKLSMSKSTRNKKKKPNSSSNYWGVSFNNRIKKWQSRINVDGIRKFLGWFDTETEAAKKYDLACWEAYKDMSKLNFPEDYQLEVLY
jgi:group I intron endonuclease